MFERCMNAAPRREQQANPIMPLTSRCQPLLVNTASPDHQGYLVLVDDHLVAVLVRLEPDEHLAPELRERWFVEAGFGPCQVRGRTWSFASPADALGWARQQVEEHARESLIPN